MKKNETHCKNDRMSGSYGFGSLQEDMTANEVGYIEGSIRFYMEKNY